MSRILNFQTASSGRGRQKRLQPLFKAADILVRLLAGGGDILGGG